MQPALPPFPLLGHKKVPEPILTSLGRLFFPHGHQPIAAFRRANQQHYALGERLALHRLIEFGRERTAFFSTCMTSMPPRMPAREARPSGSTSLTSAPLNPA